MEPIIQVIAWRDGREHLLHAAPLVGHPVGVLKKLIIPSRHQSSIANRKSKIKNSSPHDMMNRERSRRYDRMVLAQWTGVAAFRSEGRRGRSRLSIRRWR